MSCDLCDDGQRAALGSCSATQAATTALVVATATRASEEAGSETYYAPGTRPAPPSEVAGPQGAAATVDVDATTVSYLLSVALAVKKEEEEKEKEVKEKEAEEVKAREERKAKFEEKMLVINRRVRDGAATPPEEAAWRRWMGIAPGSSSSTSGKRRKRKKRRKRRTPCTSSLPGRARRRHRQWHVSLRHVVDVPVVRFVLCPQVLISSNDEICADNYIYFRFKLIGKGRSEQWEVFLYCDKTIKMTVIARKCCPGVCLRLAFVVSASVLHPTWQRITPSMSCACLLSVSWNGLQSGRSTLEREVQWDFRVHGSSCGTCCDVLHSPLTVSTIDATTTVVALYSASADCTGFAVPMCSAGACVAMSCDGGCFTPDGAYDSLWVAMPMKEVHHLFLPVPRGRWVCLHAQGLVQLLRRSLRRQLQLPGSS